MALAWGAACKRLFNGWTGDLAIPVPKEDLVRFIVSFCCHQTQRFLTRTQHVNIDNIVCGLCRSVVAIIEVKSRQNRHGLLSKDIQSRSIDASPGQLLGNFYQGFVNDLSDAFSGQIIDLSHFLIRHGRLIVEAEHFADNI